MNKKIKLKIVALVIILIWTTLIYSNTFNNSFHFDDEPSFLSRLISYFNNENQLSEESKKREIKKKSATLKQGKKDKQNRDVQNSTDKRDPEKTRSSKEREKSDATDKILALNVVDTDTTTDKIRSNKNITLIDKDTLDSKNVSAEYTSKTAEVLDRYGFLSHKVIDKNTGIQANSRPVLDLTYTLNYKLSKLNVSGYHIGNLLIHLSVSVLIYFITHKIFSRTNLLLRRNTDTETNTLLPIFSSLLFATHPINSQAVNYISARSSSLCALLMMLSFFLFVLFSDKYLIAGRIKNKKENSFPVMNSIQSVLLLCGSVIFFVLAVGTRKQAGVLPVILLCFSYYFYNEKYHSNEIDTPQISGKKLKHKILNCLHKANQVIKHFKLYHAPFWAIIIAGTIKLELYNRFSLYVPLHMNIMTACKAYIYYLKLLFFPVNLSMHHYFPVVTSFLDLQFIISVSITSLLIALVVYLYNKARVISFSIIFYFIAPIITSSVLIISYSSMTSIIAEHRIYASSIWFCISIAIIVCCISKYIGRAIIKNCNTGKLQILQCILITPIILSYSFITFNNNYNWKDDFSLWSKAVDGHPESFIAQYNLGEEYTQKGEWDESIVHYTAALKQNYNDFQTHNNLGIAYKEKKQFEMAINEFETAIMLNSSFPDTHFNLAISLELNNNIDYAIDTYNQSLELKPDNIIAIYNLASIFLEKGELNKAEEMFKKALNMARSNMFNSIELYGNVKSTLNEIIKKAQDSLIPKLLNNIGIVNIKKGNIEPAIDTLNEALQIDYFNAEIHYNLGWAQYKKDFLDLAEDEFKIALKLKPDFAEAHNYMGIIYGRKNENTSAINEFKLAVKSNPDFYIAYKNLGLAYLITEDKQNAILHLSTSLKLNPEQKDSNKIKILLENLTKK